MILRQKNVQRLTLTSSGWWKNVEFQTTLSNWVGLVSNEKFDRIQWKSK